MIKCDLCSRDLDDGDVAYVQEYRVITVRGTKIREATAERIVCPDCAADGIDTARRRRARHAALRRWSHHPDPS